MQMKGRLVCLHRRLYAHKNHSSYFEGSSGLPTEPPTPATKTSNELRTELKNVNIHLSTLKSEWENEKQKLLGEKHVLQEAANRLNMQMRNAEEERVKASSLHRADQKQSADVQTVSITCFGKHPLINADIVDRSLTGPGAPLASWKKT
jgi:hypothetical protein